MFLRRFHNYIACSQAVDFYLGNERPQERATIINLVNLKKPEDDPTAMKYIRDLQSLRRDTASSAHARLFLGNDKPFGSEEDSAITPQLRDVLLMGYIREAQSQFYLSIYTILIRYPL
jgi:hypothetical protein